MQIHIDGDWALAIILVGKFTFLAQFFPCALAFENIQSYTQCTAFVWHWMLIGFVFTLFLSGVQAANDDDYRDGSSDRNSQSSGNPFFEVAINK